jgi:hypothetical protein
MYSINRLAFNLQSVFDGFGAEKLFRQHEERPVFEEVWTH